MEMSLDERQVVIFKSLVRNGKSASEADVRAIGHALEMNYSNNDASDDIIETRIELEVSKY